MSCPVPGCTVEVDTTKFVMCRVHWRKVPAALRHEVWNAWRAREDALDDDDVAYGPARDRHEHAKAAAIASVSSP